MDAALLNEARKKGKIADFSEEIAYSAFHEKFKGIPRGTVLVSGQVIYGFPKIKRIFTLAKGLAKNVKAEYVWAEEKIDGYNLRVAKTGKNVFAFSRGGFVDPFATEKVREMGLDRFFRDYPDHILCGEMIGSTPYTPPVKGIDVKFLVFDIADEKSMLIPVEVKYALLRRYGIEGVPVLGKFAVDDVKKLQDAALMLNKGNKEGMVLKSPDRREVVKYVCPNADIEDIGRSSHAWWDMPSGFFHQRVLRSAIFLRDAGLDRKKYAAELGAAFYEKLVSAMNGAESGEGVWDEFEILIKNPETWDRIIKHMGKAVKIEVLSRREEKNGIRIRFRKVYRESAKRLHEILNGKGVED